MGQKLVAYYRVSTAKQWASGLGLEGQEAAVASYARATGGHVLRAYTEIETGKRCDRPERAGEVPQKGQWPLMPTLLPPLPRCGRRGCRCGPLPDGSMPTGTPRGGGCLGIRCR
jgi:hypothetical protein